MYDGPNGEESSPWKQNGKGMKRSMRRKEEELPSSQNFPIYNEHYVFGMGYMCWGVWVSLPG